MDHNVESAANEGAVSVPLELVKELWTVVKGARDHAMMMAVKYDELNGLLNRMKAAGMADWIPTIEQVIAAGPYVRVEWDETYDEACTRQSDDHTNDGTPTT